MIVYLSSVIAIIVGHFNKPMIVFSHDGTDC
jgi:hypothetical protein